MASKLLDKINSGDAIVGVVGLGYVGLPLVREFTRGGAKVIGFDVDPEKIELLMAGKSYIKHIATETVQEMVDGGNFEATTDFDRLSEPDCILICVPTPLTKMHEPDMTYVVATAESVGKRLRKEQLVVLESTTYPGTSREVMLPILQEASGLQVGKDFYLGYSPEREDPGREDYTTKTIPKVVGGYDRESLKAATACYEIAIDTVVPVTSCEAAEAAKILENTYRCVNIALVNELKVLFDKMGIDVWEVIRAASTKPFGFTAFYPGPGLGGHCIPIDPFYLSWKAKEYGQPTRFIELAGEVNVGMPDWVVHKVMEALNDKEKALKGSKILVLGLAYKPNIDDDRESPSYELIELLKERGAKVSYNDPYCPVIKPTREHPHLAGMKSVPLTEKSLPKYDAVLISTNHKDYDYQWVVDNAQLVIDTRNACNDIKRGKRKVVKA
ncbi:MAG: nucleotide sugar dehydrogenase [Phycisphaerae bacterium]